MDTPEDFNDLKAYLEALNECTWARVLEINKKRSKRGFPAALRMMLEPKLDMWAHEDLLDFFEKYPTDTIYEAKKWV